MKPPTHNGKEWIKLAKKNGLQVESGKGDHVKIIAPEGRGFMVIPLNREIHTGLNHAIAKWFKALGIITSLLLIILGVLK